MFKTILNCCLAFHVDFQDIGQLAGYTAMVDDLLNTSQDNPSIGLLICKEKNDVVARWTLEGNQQQPIGISTYRISDLLPTDKQISDRIHQLEQELERLRKLQQKNAIEE